MAMAFRPQMGMGASLVPDLLGGQMQPPQMQPAQQFGMSGLPAGGGVGPAGLTQQLPPVQPAKRPGMFGGAFRQGGVGRAAAGYFGDALLRMSGGQPMYAPMMQQREQRSAEQEEFQRRYDLQRADQMADREDQRNQPQFFSGNEDRLRYDPTTGQTTTLYDAPTAAQDYAQSMGYQPDTPEYRTAMQDYTLKGYGSTAMAARMQQDQQRTEDRLAVRSAPTYRDTHARPAAPARPRAQASYAPPRTTNAVVAPILAKMSRGQPLTANEQAVLDYNRRGGGGGGRGGAAPRAAAGGSPQMMRNPKTGEIIRWDASSGKWVPQR